MVSGAPLPARPGIHATTRPTSTATAVVATTVIPLTAPVMRRGTSCSRIAAPAGITRMSVSQGAFIAR